MEKEKIILGTSKGMMAMIVAIFSYMYQSITELIVVLVLLMILDYITGLIAAAISGTIESAKSIGSLSWKKGLSGIVKKVGYIVLVGIAIIFDYVIYYLGAEAGISIGIKGIFTLLVTCWLIATELLSLVENLGNMGVPIPPFLKNAFLKLKDISGEMGDEANETDDVDQ